MRKIAAAVFLLLLAGCASTTIVTGGISGVFKGKIRLSYVSESGPAITGYGFIVSLKSIKAGNGRLYLADQGANKVVVMNYNGVYQDVLGGPDTFTGGFKGPVSTAADSGGNVFVLEQDSCTVRKINRLKDIVSSFGARGRDEKSFFAPSDIAVNSYGDVYVCDTGNDTIKKVDVFGNFSSSFGHFGYGRGFFSGPAQIAVDPGNNVYVLDAGNKRVQKFGPANDFLAMITASGDGFGDPAAMALDNRGDLFVADDKAGKIFFYSNDGTLLGNFRPEKTFGPATSMTIAEDRYLFLADNAAGKIYKFALSYE